MKRKNKANTKQLVYALISLLVLVILAYFTEFIENKLENTQSSTNIVNQITYSSIEDIPEYSGEICIKINENKPYFNETDLTTEPFENYSELDSLGRCGVAYANVCKETMPPKGDERGKINSIRPSGWKQAKFNGEYLYNRCHLIAYSLSDEDANKLNLITGTRYFNVQGMLPMEKMVLDYLNKNTENHVLYRVTPIFKGENLLATGVEMEAYSVEDNGNGICFNVFVYNVQPGANINYTTGEMQE